MARSTAAAGSARPSPWRSNMATVAIAPIGFARSRPAMSGADPWIGSNRPGPSPSEAGGRGDRESVGEGKRGDLGGRRILKKKKKKKILPQSKVPSAHSAQHNTQLIETGSQSRRHMTVR